ncbi:MAG: type II secretion system protein [Chthoniobacterales bacterium]
MKSSSAFSLIELMLVMAIIGILLTLWLPQAQQYFERSRSIICMNNLRQTGVIVNNYISDHNYFYPEVETDPANPVYLQNTLPGMQDTFQPYGLSQNLLRCPSDMAANKQYNLRGTSYEWRPFIDDENYNAPQIYTRRGPHTVSPRRLRLVTDIDAVHFGRQNALYADGHVLAITTTP